MAETKNNFITGKAFAEEYYKILSPEFPVFLSCYVNTPAMQRLEGISISCGCNYTKLYRFRFTYSNLQHSIGTALIVWHFTRDKKATLAALFHDISTPCFKHCVDFMKGDSLKQETTENLTEQTIRNSQEIMHLLERDGIAVEEVCNYKIYPVADNPTPQLSADRLEYTFANGVFWLPVWNMKKISQIYNDLTVLPSENGLPELGFKTKDIAEDFLFRASKLWPLWFDSKNKLLMQFYADILSEMKKEGLLDESELYTLSEKQLLKKIRNGSSKRIANAFCKFQNATRVFESQAEAKDKYCKKLLTKKRYIIPLSFTDGGAKRITELSEKAKRILEDWQQFEVPPFAYFDFNF